MNRSLFGFKEFVASRLLEENDLCMFFTRDGSVYGATESGRITFARMKNPESKDDMAWRKDASMILYDLGKGPDSKVVVGYDDLGSLKPISQDKAEAMLKEKGKEMPSVSDDDDGEDGYFGEE